MYTYLAIAKKGNEKLRRVKSFPMIQKLYKGLLGITLENKIAVTRDQIITSDMKINIIKSL